LGSFVACRLRKTKASRSLPLPVRSRKLTIENLISCSAIENNHVRPVSNETTSQTVNSAKRISPLSSRTYVNTPSSLTPCPTVKLIPCYLCTSFFAAARHRGYTHLSDFAIVYNRLKQLESVVSRLLSRTDDVQEYNDLLRDFQGPLPVQHQGQGAEGSENEANAVFTVPSQQPSGLVSKGKQPVNAISGPSRQPVVKTSRSSDPVHQVTRPLDLAMSSSRKRTRMMGSPPPLDTREEGSSLFRPRHLSMGAETTAAKRLEVSTYSVLRDCVLGRS